MANKHLRLKPHDIRNTDDVWWYEEPAGITLVVPDRASGHAVHLIQWRSVRAALARKDKSKDA